MGEAVGDAVGATVGDGVAVAIAGSAVTVIADVDFNEYTSGSPDGVDTGSVASNGGYVSPVFIDEEHGQSLELGAEGTTPVQPFFGIPTGDTNDTVQAEFEVYFPDDRPASLSLSIRNSATPDSISLAHFRPYSSNEIYIPGSGGESYGNLNMFETGKWYTVKYIINGADNTYSMWLDDMLLAKDRKGDNDKVTVLNQLRFLISSSSDNGGRVIFDNVKAQIITNFPYVTGFGSAADGTELDYVDYSANTVYAELSSPVDADSIEEEMTLFCRGEEVEISDISLSEDSKKVYFSVPRLFSNTEYTLTLGDGLLTAGGTQVGYEQSESFTTSMKPLDIAEAGFGMSGTEKSFNAVIKNDTAEDTELTAVLNIRSGNEITASSSAAVKAVPGMDSSVKTGGIKTAGSDVAEGIVFAADGTLVGDTVFEEGETAAPAGIAGYDPETGSVTVSYDAEYALMPVGIMIAPYGETAVNADMINGGRAVYTAVYAGSGGSAVKMIGLSGVLEGGKYTVYIAAGNDVTEYLTFMHLNKASAQQVMASVNAADSASEMNDIISANADALGVDTDEFEKNPGYISRLVFENKPDGGYEASSFYREFYSAVAAMYIVDTDDAKAALEKYASVIGIDAEKDINGLSEDVWEYAYEYMKKQDYSEVTPAEALLAGTVLGEIAGASRYTELKDIIVPNAAQLGIDTDDYEKITYKDEVWKYFYNNRSKAADLDSLRDLFEDAVENAGKSMGGNTGGTGGGTGGSSGGSGGGNLGTFVDNIDEIISGTEKSDFSDVSGHWAEDIISEMAEKGIIAGFDDGTFKPDEKVTRAQFCKMIVTALGLSGSSDGKTYGDVPAGAWYETYVKTADANGIVMGDGENFHPDSSITRQDAAVMIYRGIRAVGRNVFGSKTFNDSDAIADYAADEISRLGGAGIINGMDDGTFRPLNNATRAESASMIMNMINYIGE